MTTLDQDLKAAFALLDLSNFKWLDEKEIEALPKPTKRGSMTVPLDRETGEEMRDATKFTGHWLTQARQIMKKPRLFRVEVRMYRDGESAPIQATAIMRKPDTVHTLWNAIGEAGDFIMSQYESAEWIQSKCVAVVKV